MRNFPVEIRAASTSLVARLAEGRQRQTTRLAELEPTLVQGNAIQGRGVFFGTKGACANCHTVDAKGGNIGPDLSKIGAIRSPRDLLESVLFPSASFVRSYEPCVVTTDGGIILNGVLQRETATAVHLITTDRMEHRVPRSSIEDIQPGRVSIMPEGLDAQLTSQELRDLIAYLVSLK